MNTPQLQLVHRAIRGDRSALRSLIERYQGFSYAHAYLNVHSFPVAQRVVKKAWCEVSKQLPSLTEPERFSDLLKNAVDKVAKSFPPIDPHDAKAAEGHSVLRTEKVRARRSLREALSTCTLPEAPVFFMKFVEGLSLQDIGQLYAVDQEVVVESFRLVCTNLAFRSGFVENEKKIPDLKTISIERKNALGYAAVLSEGQPSEEQCAANEKAISLNAECKRDNDGVCMVLALADGTFSAHRLPQEFIRDVLLEIPFTEAPRNVLPTGKPSLNATPPTNLMNKEIPGGPALSLSFASAFSALIFILWIVDAIITPIWGWTPTPVLGSGNWGIWILALGGGATALFLARPPIFAKTPKLPLWYFILYGFALGGLAGFTCLLIPFQAPRGTQAVIKELLVPLWILYIFIMTGVRIHLTFLDLERRMETRLRRIEDSIPMLAPKPKRIVEKKLDE